MGNRQSPSGALSTEGVIGPVVVPLVILATTTALAFGPLFTDGAIQNLTQADVRNGARARFTFTGRLAGAAPSTSVALFQASDGVAAAAAIAPQLDNTVTVAAQTFCHVAVVDLVALAATLALDPAPVQLFANVEVTAGAADITLDNHQLTIDLF